MRDPTTSGNMGPEFEVLVQIVNGGVDAIQNASVALRKAPAVGIILIHTERRACMYFRATVLRRQSSVATDDL